MSAAPHAAFADAAMASIRGTTDAQHLLHRIRQGVAGPDALLTDFLEVQATGDAARLRGWCREIGKALERAT